MKFAPFVHQLQIIDKKRGSIPLTPNWAQADFMSRVEEEFTAGRPFRGIVLKARQIGISTMTEALMFTASFAFRNNRGLVISHDQPSYQHLLGMSKHYWDTFFARSLYTTDYSSRRELKWNETKSSITTATAKNVGAGRSQTIHWLHASEVAFWPNPEELVTGLRQSVPNEPGTFICLESTANGVGNYFHTQWQMAARGESEFIPLFYPWWKHPEYTAEIARLPLLTGPSTEEERFLRNFLRTQSLTPAEIDSRLTWRRFAIRDLCLNDPTKFQQEYPANPEEAFISTGRNVFPITGIRACYQPMNGTRGYIRLTPSPIFSASPEGPATIYRHPSKDRDHGRYIVAGDPTHTCYSDDTEVLTRRGWTLFQDALPDDEFATRTPDGELEYQHASEFIFKDVDGPMVRFYSQSLDLLVTPNHRMLIDSHLAKTPRPRFVRADWLAENATSRTRIPRQAWWVGEKIDRFVLPRRHKCPGIDWSGEDYCAFMGMWLSEGNLGRKGRVEVTQAPTSKGYGPFTELLDRLGVRWRHTKQGKFEFTNIVLHEYLQQFGNAHTKYVPQQILDTNTDQLETFWRYAWYGDGSTNRGQEVICTSSRRLADGYQEIILKLGHSGNVNERTHADQEFRGRTIRQNGPNYLIRRSTSKNAKFNSETINWKGRVACVTVPNGTLYVRRKNKAIWCGNTRGDYAVIQVINRRTLEQCARIRLKIDPTNFARELVAVARYYNDATIVTETTGPGYATIGALMTLGYPHIWQAQWADKTPGSIADQYGFQTNVQRKNWAIGALLNTFVEHSITIHDSITFDELVNYVTLDNGGYGPAAGKHGYDDCVMALAIAVLVHTTLSPLPPYGASPNPFDWEQWRDDSSIQNAFNDIISNA